MSAEIQMKDSTSSRDVSSHLSESTGSTDRIKGLHVRVGLRSGLRVPFFKGLRRV